MSTFLDKNKKKSALAALLLFFRERKSLSALLLAVAVASFLFLSPAYVLLHLPGGTRLAAGAIRLGSRLGVDTSQWGQAGDKRRFGDLLAALRAAKAGGAKSGWSSFMRGVVSAAKPAAAGSGSLGFVKGSRKDLEAAGGNGSGDGAKPPRDVSKPGALDPWAFSEEDMYGERPGLVRSAFAGGFADVSNLSGGAFASKGFFSGSGPSAASVTLRDRVNGGLDGLGAPQTAKGAQIQGAAKGRLSADRASAINKRMSRGAAGVHTISAKGAFVQLAQGRGRAEISIAPKCTDESGCPGEFAATNTGAIYDGNSLTGANTDILTRVSESVPAVPLNTDIPVTADPEKLNECAAKAADCEKGKQPLLIRLGQLQTQLNGLLAAMPGACGNPCKCGPCNGLKSSIQSLCGGELTSTLNAIDKPCALPPYCKDLGVETPSSSSSDSGKNLCRIDMGSCKCGFFCKFMCMFK